MKRIVAAILALSVAPAASFGADAPQFSIIYRGEEGTYKIVRTPQLLVTKSGALLAFAQGRSGAHDRSDNDILLKRSTDGGNTWSAFQVVADGGRDSLNSICVLQLRELGRILLSYDDGQTWPVQKVVRPGRFKYNCLARLPDGG